MNQFNIFNKNQRFFQEYNEYIQYLPTMERGIIELVLDGTGQEEIAAQFKITQGAVSARLSRAKVRLPYLKFIKDFDFSNIEKDLGYLFDPIELEVLKSISETSCQTDSARRINDLFNLTGDQKMNQVKVRHRFEKCLIVLERNIKKTGSPQKELYTQYLFFFKYVKHNLYKLHEVKLPQHSR